MTATYLPDSSLFCLNAMGRWRSLRAIVVGYTQKYRARKALPARFSLRPVFCLFPAVSSPRVSFPAQAQPPCPDNLSKFCSARRYFSRAAQQQNRLYPTTKQHTINRMVKIVSGINSSTAIPDAKQNSIRPHILLMASSRLQKAIILSPVAAGSRRGHS